MGALLTSFAYVSILNTSWVCKQQTDDAIDVINDKLDHADPSIECLRHFKQAYIDTMKTWQRSVVTYRQTFGQALHDPSWIHFWNWKSDFRQSPGPNPPGKGKGAQKKFLSNVVFQTLQRYGKSGNKNNWSGGKPSGGKPMGKVINQFGGGKNNWGGKNNFGNNNGGKNNGGKSNWGKGRKASGDYLGNL